MDPELRTLVSERGRLKTSLTRFKRYFTESRDSVTIASLQKRLESYTGLLESFRKIQDQIDSLVEGTDAAATHEVERETFETTYFDLISAAEEYIKGSRPLPAPEFSATPLNSSCVPASNVDTQLPAIQLPSFDVTSTIGSGFVTRSFR